MTPLTFLQLLAFVQRRCPPRLVSFAAFLIGMFLGPVPPAHAVDLITVNATTELADTSRRPVGINTNYLMDSERRRLSVPPRTTQAAIQEMGGRFMRYPGGEKSDSYLWSVAPWTNSQPTLARTGPNEWPAGSRQFTLSDNVSWIPGKEPLNFDEFMGICQAAGGEPVLVVCYDSMYKSLTTGGTRPTRAQLLTTATEWVRYANVIKGYGVKYWSIGNETDYNSDGNPGAAQYATDLIAFSQAMKAIDPTTKKTKVDFLQYWNTRWVDNDGFALPLGSTNLITNNPGFESNLTGWTENLDVTTGNTSMRPAPAWCAPMPADHQRRTGSPSS